MAKKLRGNTVMKMYKIMNGGLLVVLFFVWASVCIASSHEDEVIGAIWHIKNMHEHPWFLEVIFASIITILLLVAVIFFDFLGIRTFFKWIIIFLGIVGLLIGGYFVYLRTKDG